jgi:uncharacterized protein YdcH (DUF465 family)
MSRRRERGTSAEFIVERLRSEHARLDAEAAELDHRLHLSSQEEMRLHELKKAKLRAKDKLRELRR